MDCFREELYSNCYQKLIKRKIKNFSGSAIFIFLCVGKMNMEPNLLKANR